jgi:phosphonate transport system ATP-binding protein
VKLSLENISAQHPANRRGEGFSLRGISLNIQSGEHVAIIGPSGSGKTTLLQIFAAAIKPASGSLRLGEVNPWALSTPALQKLRSRLFYAPQVAPLPPRQRVVTTLSASRLTQMTLAQSVLNLIYPQYTQEAIAALDLFDLKEKIWNRVDRLSGGERQRVGLARVLMSNAELWLVDEPLSALDPKRSKQAINTLIAEANKRGATLVVTLHQVDVATNEFPRVIGLKDGHIDFDLTSNLVTKEILQELYAQNQYEISSIEPHEIFSNSSLETPTISSLCKPQ